jgi:hypothetical protein
MGFPPPPPSSDQARDARLRSEPAVGAPRCHFFPSFFYNKLFQVRLRR